MFHSSMRIMVNGMVSASQIRQKLAAFLEGCIDLDSFEDWFVQNTWNIHQSGSIEAESLTFAVEESLSEYSSMHLDERGLRNELYRLLQLVNQDVEIVNAPQVKWGGDPSPVLFVKVAA